MTLSGSEKVSFFYFPVYIQLEVEVCPHFCIITCHPGSLLPYAACCSQAGMVHFTASSSLLLLATCA